jgi:hypothetical protein
MTRQERIEAAVREYFAKKDAWYASRLGVTWIDVQEAEKKLRAAMESES